MENKYLLMLFVDMDVNLLTFFCIECDCHPNGTLADVCNDVTGECLCIEFATGSSCGECEPGYWGLSQGLGCVDCNCCTNGTVDSSPACDQVKSMYMYVW